MSSPNLSQVELRAQLRDATRGRYSHRPHTIIVEVITHDDGRVTALLECFNYTETVREVRFTGKYTRLIEWTPLGNGRVKVQHLDMPEPDFRPYTEARYGVGESVAEYRARREWEGMQYRVGTAKTPMDNADVSAAPDMPMHHYWMKG